MGSVSSDSMPSAENPGKPSIGRNGGKQDSDNGLAKLPLKGSRPTNMAKHAGWQQPYFTEIIKGG